jgi:hypothetical protein
MEPIQLLNTAIIKSKEKSIKTNYEDRLKKICNSPVMEAVNKSINYLSDSQKISRDQAAVILIETLRELDEIWEDYVLMEGIDRLKSVLKTGSDSSNQSHSHH